MIEDKVDLYLIKEVQNGNTKAFNALVLKYQYKLFKIISKFVYDSNDVTDIAQESFIKAYNAIDKFRGDSAFYTWLYRIAINTTKNYLIDKNKTISNVEFNEEDFENMFAKNLPRDNNNPESEMLCGEIETALYDIINKLPNELKTAIMLREIEGLSYQEIAEIMECPVGTIRSRIFRAREEIDNHVSPYLRRD